MMLGKRYLKVGIIIFVILVVVIGGVWAFFRFKPVVQSVLFPQTMKYSPTFFKPDGKRTKSDWILIGAKEEIMGRVKYNADYRQISYPNGDVDRRVGACTDVVIRGLRRAGFDLQELIHEDMKANFHLYPKRWGLTAPDSNIDHRRVPNQIVFLQRYGTALPVEYNEETKDTWQPGDLVYWRMPSGRDHTGVVSDRRNFKGVPLVIHNMFMTVEDDALLQWEIKGHYRFPKVND